LLVALVAFAPLLGLVGASPAIQALEGVAAALKPIADPQLLARILPDIKDWSVVGRIVVGANVLVGLARGWAALDAALVARRQRRVHAYGRFTAGSLAWVSGVAGVLAFVLVLAPHAAAFAAGEAVRPLLAPMLVSTAHPTKPVAAPPTPAPNQPPPEPTVVIPTWDMSTRLNVLLLGSDRRPDEVSGRYGNSDTMIVVSIAEGMRSASLISIPRDIYLNIPGVGMEKINAAHREGGPPLAVRVISTLINQPIHRWASVDITAFGTIIDAVGGVVIDVERPLRDDEFPTENYAIRRVLLPAGLSWFDGPTALVYARSRHESNDFDRASRQQKLLLALKNRAHDPAIVSHLPQLLSTLSDAVQTDATPREMLALASLGANADVGTVRSLVLTPPRYGQEIIRSDFYGILPDVQRIRTDVAQFLSPNTSLGNVIAAPPTESPAEPQEPQATAVATEPPVAQGGGGS
jgi:LCP family protein required for cell wall assembly